MVQFPIPSSSIHHIASTKTLTLDPPYNLLTISNILRIYDLTKGVDIYNYQVPRKHKEYKGAVGADISITNGVITYIEEAELENGDDIQIIVDDLLTVNTSVTVDSATPLTVNVNNTALPIDSTVPVNVNISNTALSVNDSTPLNVNVNGATNTSSNLFTSQTVAASATVKSTTPIQTGQLSKLLCYVSNSGASTNVTVNIYASPTDSTTGRRRAITPPFTLGAGNVITYETGCGVDPQQLDNYIWGEIINGGTTDAIITVEFSMFR